MDSYLKSIIEEIKKQSGLSLSVYSENGVLVFGEGRENIVKKEGIVSIEGDTYFDFKINGKKYIGKICGDKEEQKIYANLLITLLEKQTIGVKTRNQREFFKGVILGELSNFEIENYKNKFSLNAEGYCAVKISVFDNRGKDVFEVLNQYVSGKDSCIDLDNNGVLIIKELEEDAEYRSLNEYAEFLSQMIYEEIGVEPLISIGGTVKNIKDLPVSFSQAQATENSFILTNDKKGIVSYKNFILDKMLEELPKYRLNEFLEILKEEKSNEIFNDKEMLDTADAFIKNNLNVSETARKMFLHRNTLIYRLDKIERGTGLDIRKFSDALSFFLITVLMRLIKL